MSDKVSKALEAMVNSATRTAATEDMHAELRISPKGIVVSVTSVKNGKTFSEEKRLDWSEIDRSGDLDVSTSSETLTLMAKIQRQTGWGPA